MSSIREPKPISNQPFCLKAIVLNLVVSLLILSFILAYMSEPLKYILFGFAVALSIFLHMRMVGQQVFISLQRKGKVSFALDCLGFAVSVLVCAQIALNFHFPILMLASSAIMTLLVPGWVVLRLGRFQTVESRSLGVFIFSILISIGFSAIVMTLFIFFSYSNAFVFGLIYLAISSLPILFRKPMALTGVSTEKGIQITRYNLYEILLLSWTIIFILIVLFVLYPGMSTVPTFDIVRHYTDVRQLLLDPKFYDSEYPWFHLFESAIFLSSEPPDWLFQSALSLISTILVLCFYLMAKSYLHPVDSRSAIIATVFFFAFAGFGWVYLVDNEIISSNDESHSENLLNTYFVSYWDSGLGQSSWLWLWFRPITLGFSVFFVLLYLLTKVELPRFSFMALFSFFVLLLWQIHIPELIILVLLIFVLSIFRPSAATLRLKEACLCMLLILPMSLGLEVLYDSLFSSVYSPTSPVIYVAIIFLSLTSYALNRFKISALRRKVRMISPSKRSSGRLSKIITVVLIGGYSILVLNWLIGAEADKIEGARAVLALPPHLYPMMLGIVGILSIPGVVLIFQRYRSRSVIVFPILLILVFIAGRGITYLYSLGIETGYWERRFVPFIFAASSIIAAVYVPKGMDKLVDWLRSINARINGVSSNLLFPTVFSTLILLGISSIFLTVEYSIYNQERYGLAESEVQLLEGFRDKYPNSTVLTVSDRSLNVAEFSANGWIIKNLRDEIWTSSSPETPLYFLNQIMGSSLIFLSEQDLEQISENNVFKNGYVNSFLMNSNYHINQTRQNDGIIVIPSMSSPTSESNTVLVLPRSQMLNNGNDDRYGKNFNKVYSLLALGKLNFTTALDSDVLTLSRAENIIVTDEDTALDMMRAKSQFNLNFKNMAIFNIDGYGQILTVDPEQQKSLIKTVDANNPNLQSFESPQSKGTHMNITDTPSEISLQNGDFPENGAMFFLMPTTENLTQYNTLVLNWHGKNDGNYYTLRLMADNGRASWIQFVDDWTGWRQILLPLDNSSKISSGRSFGTNYLQVSNIGVLPYIKGFEISSGGGGGNKSEATVEEFRTIKFRDLSVAILEPKSIGNSLFRSENGNNSYTNSIRSIVSKSDPVKVYNVSYPSSLNPKVYYNTTNGTVPFWLSDSGSPSSNNNNASNYDFNLTYVNLVPLIEVIDINTASEISEILGSLLPSSPLYEFDEGTVGISNFLANNFSSFESTWLRGNVSIDTDSLSLGLKNSLNTTSELTSIRIDNNSFIEFENLREINPTRTGSIRIVTNSAIIEDGQGFYAGISSNHSQIVFKGSSPMVSLGFENGSSIQLNAKDSIDVIYSEPSYILARNPKVNVDGIAEFQNLNGYGPVSKRLVTTGQDISINGHTSFNIKFADRFIISEKSSFSGEIDWPEPIYNYDEMYSVFGNFSVENIPAYVILISIMIIIYGSFDLVRKRSRRLKTV